MLFPPGLMFRLTWLGLCGFFRGMGTTDLAVEVIERPEAGIALSLAWDLQVMLGFLRLLEFLKEPAWVGWSDKPC